MLKVIARAVKFSKAPNIYHQNHYSFSFKKRFIDYAIKRSQQDAKLRAELQGTNQTKQDTTQHEQTINKQQENLSEQQKQVISSYKVDRIWNLILKQPPTHNFQKDLILHRKQFQNSTRQLRSAILFEDLLKTELDILIYDTKGRPYAHYFLKFIYLLLTVGAALWSIHAIRTHDPKNAVLLDRTTLGKTYKVAVYLLSAALFIVTLARYHTFSGKYVQKIVYNTQKEEFTFTKRSFFCRKYPYVASRFKILYTENPYLNRQGTNYFDIDTKEEFSIVYKESWVKQDLFSHLISQRIKL